MIEEELAPLSTWLVAPMEQLVADAVRRLRRAPGVVRVAVMPDIHLAEDVCAYKDIRAVARAQGELVKIARALRPVLSFKGT